MSTATLALITAAGLLAAPAQADTTLTQHVYNTAGLGLYLHPDAATLASSTSEVLPDGAAFDITCYTVGDSVLGDSVWDYGTDPASGATGYLADYYVDTPVTQGNEPAQLDALGLSRCGDNAGTTSPPTSAPTQTSSGGDPTVSTPVAYNRDAAVQWASDNLNTPPSFTDDDCTWYVSQALWAGGLPQSDVWNGDSWNWSLKASRAHFPGPTRDAARADDLVNYLISTGMASRTPINWSDNSAAGAQPGDIIAYHWNDNEPPQQVDHLSFVSDVNADGYPNIDQHSPAVHRYWSWDPGGPGREAGWIQQIDRPNGQDPTAWLIHINDGPTF